VSSLALRRRRESQQQDTDHEDDGPRNKANADRFCRVRHQTNLFSTTLDRTTKGVGSRFRNRFSRQRGFERIAQFAAVDLCDVAAVVYATVIEELVAGVKKICLGGPSCSSMSATLFPLSLRIGKVRLFLAAWSFTSAADSVELALCRPR